MKNNTVHSFKGLAMLLVIFLSMMAVMRITAAKVGQLSGGQGILDLSFAVTPDKIISAFAGYTKAAGEFYRWVFLSVDMVYALAYCTFYRCALKTLMYRLGAGTKMSTFLVLMPVIGMISDLLENTVMFILLSGSRAWILCAMFTVFNVIKFVFVYSSLAIVLGGIICLIKKHFS